MAADVVQYFHALSNDLPPPNSQDIAAERPTASQTSGFDTLELLVELRTLIASADSIDEAWRHGLERVGQLAKFRTGMVWQSTEHDLVVTHVWGSDKETQDLVATRLGEICSDRIATAVGQTWATGTSRWVQDVDAVCDVGNPGVSTTESSSGPVLLVPVLASTGTEAVVEFVGDRPHHNVEQIVEVVSQLGFDVRRKQVEQRLTETEEQLRNAFENAAIGMAIVDPDGWILRANSALCRFFGRNEQELIRTNFRTLTHPDDVEAGLEGQRQLVVGEQSEFWMETQYLHASGRAMWAQLSLSLVRDADGQPLHFVVQIEDIQSRKTAERSLEQAAAQFEAAFASTSVGMALIQLDGSEPGRMLRTNASLDSMIESHDDFEAVSSIFQLLDHADASMLQRRLVTLNDPHAPAYRCDARTVDSVAGSEQWLQIVASPVRDPNGTGKFAVLHVEDITAQKGAQDRLAYIALHDELTGLPNRTLIHDRIHNAQERSDRSGQHIGLLFIDLDKFKDVNDSLGHQAGDFLLERVATRLTSAIRPADTASRLGGDEFVVLCDELSTDRGTAYSELNSIADRIHKGLEEPVPLTGFDAYYCSASIGIDLLRGSSVPVQTALSNADVAMYRAKARGRSRTEIYNTASRREAGDRLRLASHLHDALTRNELTVVYQPIVDLQTRSVRGAEALLRWRHPELGVVPPSRFIDIAEDSELIVELGSFVISESCGLLSTRRDDAFYVTANVSARQLNRSNFVETVQEHLALHDLEPKRLAVELTENVLMDADGSSLKQLGALRSMGVGVGVDDFGTGYASLLYLRQLPISFVKIDRTFVDGLGRDPHDRTITDAVISLGRALELDVVAEGVETEQQAEILNNLGCRTAQGYLLGMPEPATN